MAATWLVALKAVLPYVEPILSLATPLFTKKKIAAVSNQAELLQQQISELQTASTQNAENIKELAEQLKSLVVALEQAGSNMESAHKQLRRLGIAAIIIAVLSLGAVIALAVK
jgi:septal ring factor EnvC (AmiA/AmiB activator)